MNEAIPPLAPQNPKVPNEEGAMNIVEIRVSIQCLTQVLATQVSRDTSAKWFLMLDLPHQGYRISQVLIPLLSFAPR